jgi:hypothetical protein
VDGGNAPGVLGQAGYAITGSGGGGAGGQYVFASLAELDGVIAEWEALRDRIRGRGAMLSRAVSVIEPPADDLMSRLQANTAARSLERAQEHRQAMEDYATGYVEKLRAARTQYSATDSNNAAQLRQAGKG